MKVEHLIKINWKSKKSIPGYLLMLYDLFLILRCFGQMKGSAGRAIGYIAFGMLLTFWYLLEFRDCKFVKRLQTWFGVFLLFLMPFASFLIVEMMVSNFNLKMFEKYSFYNLVWYFAITFLIYAVTANIKRTVLMNTILIYLVAVVNYLVYLFRGNPIIPSDLLAWQTGMSVALSYRISFTEGFLIATAIMFLMLVCQSKLGRREENHPLIKRLAGVALYSAFAVILYAAFFQTDLIKTKIKVIDYFAPKYTYCAYGTVFGFVANIEAMETKAPEGYSTEKIDQILSEATESYTEPEDSGKKPNIIAIMNEAYSDLSMLGDYQTNMDYHPYTGTLRENTTQGKLYVSVFGGATSDTEYEFLTGNSMAVMPQNSVPYQQFITDPTDSLASTLKDQGYYNVAIHPYQGSGYKRDMVYPLLGFDEFLTEKDFVSPKHIRSFISDQSSYEKIIEVFENKEKDKPLFVFNVTMQNHGGYSNDQIFDDANTVRLTQPTGYPAVEQYLSLLRQSDLAFQTLVNYFSEIEEPTIILLFGDHQPVAYSEFHNQQEKQLGEGIYQERYEVPFLIWANYDITEDDVDSISANYLSSYLLKTAGLKLTAYQKYLLQLRKEIPVINAHFYIDKNNICHQFSEQTPYTERVQEYRSVGYNAALDKEGKLTKYYYIDTER
jgi:phosphoglycerol transferase MdoB-like AlkP superfamily enzyme